MMQAAAEIASETQRMRGRKPKAPQYYEFDAALNVRPPFFKLVNNKREFRNTALASLSPVSNWLCATIAATLASLGKPKKHARSMTSAKKIRKTDKSSWMKKAARAVLFALLSLVLPLSDAHAESRKCLSFKFAAKAWLPKNDSEDGITVIQKWPKAATIKVRVTLDDMTMQNNEIEKIEQIKSQITSWFQLANLGVRFFDQGDTDTDYVLVLTTDVEGYIGKKLGYLRDFLLSSPAIKESLASLTEVERARFSDPAVIVDRIKKAGGCGSFYIANNAVIVRSYSLIDVGKPVLCAQVAISEAMGVLNAPSFAYLMNFPNEIITDEQRSFFLSKTVALLYSDKIKIGLNRADATAALEEMCK